MTDIPVHAARAAMIWERIERHLVENRCLSEDERLRVARAECIALLARGMEGLELPPLPAAPQVALPLDLGPEVEIPPIATGGSRPFVHPRPVHELTRSAVGQAAWYDAADTLNLPTPTGPGPGYTCRGCGLRVKGARHTDPRLLCQVCAAHRTTTPGH